MRKVLKIFTITLITLIVIILMSGLLTFSPVPNTLLVLIALLLLSLVFAYYAKRAIPTLVIILILGFCLVFYAMQLPQFQTTSLQKATELLSKKLGSKVKIEKARMTWFDEITLENITIYDHKNREMIFVKELYVNCKTNFSFNWEKILTFDNNLDYVMIRNPRVKLTYEPDGELNIDKWLAKIDELTASTDTTNRLKGEHNVPFTIDEAYIQDGTFTLEDPAKKRFPKEEFDYNNFTFNNVDGNLKRFFIQGDTITFGLKNMKGIDRRSNLTIKQLDTKFFYSRKSMALNDLYAKINNSTLKNSILFNYFSPKDFSNFNEKVTIEGNLKDCEIDAQDLGRFAPEMYAYRENYLLNGDFKGTVHNFLIKGFKLKFGKNSYFDGDIAIKNLPDLKKADMDLNWKLSQIDAADTRQYVGDSLYFKQVQKFGTVNFAGTFKGFYNDFTTDAYIKSAMGNVGGNIMMKIPESKALPSYFGSIMVDNLEIGKLVDESEFLQKLSFAGKIQGQGFTIKDATLDFDGKVQHIWFNGYDYKNIYVDGKMNQSLFDGRISVKDTNLSISVGGKIDFAKELNKFDIHGIVQNANLKPLGYSKNDVKFRSEISLNFEGNELDNWLGEAKFLRTVLQYDKRLLGIDSVFVTSSLSANSRNISLLSEFFNVDISGKFTPSRVITDVTRLSKEYTQYFFDKEQIRLDYYAQLPYADIANKYELDYKVTFKKSEPFFAYFYPDLYVSHGTQLSGNLNIRNTAELSLSGKIDTLRHGDLAFYNNDLDFNTSKEATSPKILTSLILSSDKQKLGNMTPTEKMEVSGAWGQGNVIEFDGRIRQQESLNKAQAFGKLTFLSEGLDITFNPKNTKLDLLGSQWMLGKDNLINVHKTDICFQDVALSNQNQSISLNGSFSEDSTKESFIDVRDFDLQTLKPISALDLKGIVNGKLMLRDIYNDAVITSDFNIDELIYKNILIGTVASEVLWDNLKQKLNINGNIVRINNEIFRLSGTYDPKDDRNPLNLKATLKKTNLEIFQSFVDDIFSNLGGYATGTLTVRGTAKDPIIRGGVNLEKGVLRLNALNSYLYFDDKINFNEEGFVAEKGFKVRDAFQNGNVAELEGGIFNGGGGNFMLGIHAYMKGRDGFKIMNTSIRDNESFYGVGMTSGDLHITGDFNNVNISANLTSRKGTKITILLDGETTVNTKEQGITFVTKTIQTTDIQLLDKLLKKDNGVKRSAQNTDSGIDSGGLKMSFNFTITPDAECIVIFDRNNQDQLNAVGNGNLSIEYDTRGGFTMSGPYTIKNGKYDFSLQNISKLRKFDIAEGSRILWSGNPYDADINIIATYTAYVLLDGIVAGTNTSELKSRYPVVAYIMLTDKLMKPTTKFDIRFNQRQIPLNLQPQVIAFEQRLHDDEQLLNNNFVGITALNRLFSDNSFKDALDSQLLLDNVSGILTNQLGNIASKIDPNLEVGVQLGNLSNVRQKLLNNMQVNFSYKFGNNIKVSVNNTILQNQDQTASNYFYGGEVEWMLNQDGSWRLKAYSRNVPNYYYNFNSNVSVNGVSLQHTRSFNTIFKRKEIKDLPMGISSKKSERKLVAQ
ncbi:translocation/assembly module TamB domain-containing protein [Emticicia sp.]|uniref:translocation/assembly module TamB domain-containing protein n=1 Tax=Emticicia sp. TaxID=1930953 RepID=UPI003753D704